MDKYDNPDGKTGASSLNKNKSNWNLSSGHRSVKEVQVEAVDFSKWLENTFQADDYIVLKMDIEGSEYEVLSKMMVDNSIDLVRE